MRIDEHPILIMDGACGTNLQEMTIPEGAWGDKEGCNEYLNLTAPEVIQALHRSFIEAGAMVLETNTFGASSIVLAEYALEKEVNAINAAAVANARAAIGERPNRYVAGSLGPSTKLPSLGHIDYDSMYASYEEQLRALLSAGVDLLIVETGQDMLQMKIALVAAFSVLEEMALDVPVMASITIERTGTMLVGTDIAAATATLEPFPLFSLGLNCATGPADMISHIRYLSHNWPARISCVPNQGLPEVQDGKTMYPLSAADYAKHMHHFVKDFGVSIVGGCCGTTPDHIRALVEAMQNVAPAERSISS
ncbi:MAG: homocysteine S-methyltransferase family protein [Lentisphaerae bacterium]|nr:homocysteine S-methyltransferase family protein [Lentisphaerota bacterium]